MRVNLKFFEVSIISIIYWFYWEFSGTASKEKKHNF